MPSLEFYTALAEANAEAERQWEASQKFELDEYGERIDPVTAHDIREAYAEALSNPRLASVRPEVQAEYDEYGERLAEAVAEAEEESEGEEGEEAEAVPSGQFETQALEDQVSALFGEMAEGDEEDEGDEADEGADIYGIQTVDFDSAPSDAQWEGFYTSREDLKHVTEEIDVAKEYFVVGVEVAPMPDGSSVTMYHLWRQNRAYD